MHAYNKLITILEIATLAINKNSSLILVDEKTLLKKVPQNQVQEKSVKMNIQMYHTMNYCSSNPMCRFWKLVRTYRKNLKTAITKTV